MLLEEEPTSLDLIVRMSSIQNTAILLKSASCSPGAVQYLRCIHTEARFPILAELLRNALKEPAGDEKILISCQGRKDLEATVALIKETFHEMGDSLVLGMEGHADIVEFSRCWEESFASHRIIVTSAMSLLHLFCYGILRMDQLSHLIFDDCTAANSNHPYCVIMKTFYLSVRAKLLAESDSILNGEDELRKVEALLPRIICFGDWPLVKDEEGFLAKRDRLAKLLEYLRLFQCVIRPLESELKPIEGHNWMPFEELVYLKDSGCFQQLQAVYMKSNLADSLQNRIEGVLCYLSEHELDTDNALVLVQSDNLALAERLLRAGPYPVQLLSIVNFHAPPQSTILVAGSAQDSDLQLLSYYLQQQTMETLSVVLVAEACLNPWLLLTLMAYAKEMPICSIRANSRAALQEQAVEMALWMAAIGASSPVDSVPFRKLRTFIGGYEAVAKSAYLIADSSPVHHWIRSTGAIITPATSIHTLLCVCSYLPHVKPCGTGLRIQTMAIKRVNAGGKELDKDRHYYMTRICLPPCLDRWIPAELMTLTGPLTPSRYSSQTLSANEALKTLHQHSVINDHLIIADEVLATFDDAMNLEADDVNPFENEEIDEISMNTDKIQELVPVVFQKNDAWQEIIPELAGPLVSHTSGPKSKDSKMHDMYAYAFNYVMDLIDESERFKAVGIKSGIDETLIIEMEEPLSADTLIHLTDDSFMNTDEAKHAMVLITRTPLNLNLRPVEVRIGANVILKGTLDPLGKEGLVSVSEAQLNTLKLFQAVSFGSISTKQYVINQDLEEEDLEDTFAVPDDRQNYYFVAVAKRQGLSDVTDVTDLESSFAAYSRFVASVGQRLGSQLRPENRKPGSWELDWSYMEDVVNPECRVNLLEQITKIRAFQAEHQSRIQTLGPAPMFEYANEPSRPPLVMDFMTFCLRRFVGYVPYNGLFYRIRNIDTELFPSSELFIRSLPDCRSFADYVQLKYGLETQHSEEHLVRAKPVENFSSLSKWLLTTSQSAGNKPRRRPDRKEQNKSDLIPEFVQILPMPYVMARMMILIPRAVHDVERQQLIHQFYEVSLPASLKLDLNLESSVSLVDSMTGPTASLSYDFERLEILGDCFLKWMSSIDVFLTRPNQAEGKLSSIRQDTVCNAALYKIAFGLNIYLHARLTPFFAKLWCPPDLIEVFSEEDRQLFPFIPHIFDEGQQRWKAVWMADERAGKRSALYHLYPDGHLVDRGNAGERVVLSGVARHQRNKSTAKDTPILSRFGHPIPPKCLADLVESIIGAVFYSASQKSPELGYKTGTDLLRGLGIVSDAMCTYPETDPFKALGMVLGTPDGSLPAALSTPDKLVVPIQSSVSRIANVNVFVPVEAEYPYEEIEAILGYRFKCRRLLFVAMTHSSVDVTNSNERLEWLGDAILDWAITKYYYEQYQDEKWMTPARITMTRQAAVCNEAFSRIAVHMGLHKYLRIDAPFLQGEIDEYVQAVKNVEIDGDDPEGPLSALSWNTRYSESQGTSVTAPKLTIPPAPKAIGDLFEGVAGAVIIDLQFDAEAFARIYMPLIRWYLDKHADPYDLPENPISDFWHDYLAAGVPPTAIEFRYIIPDAPAEEEQGKMLRASTATCQVLVRGRIVAEATAPNRELARKFATRQAVVYIRSSGWRDFLS